MREQAAEPEVWWPDVEWSTHVLSERWSLIWGVDAPQEPFDDLVKRWAEPQRHYHTLSHLGECLQMVEHWGVGNFELALAIWYHDAVYDPKSAINEAASAELVYQHLTKHLGRMPAGTTRRIQDLVLSTKHGGAADVRAVRGCRPADRGYLHDIDLAILGSPRERYMRYAADVAQEFAHVERSAFREGRSRVLESFLDKQYLYLTEHGADYEFQARSNMRWEIGQLAAA